jgi:ribonuclease-3
VASRVLGSGQGRSKKAAEQQAAEAAWNAITAEVAGQPMASAVGPDLTAAPGDPAPGAAALGDDTYDGGQAPGPEPEA